MLFLLIAPALATNVTAADMAAMLTKIDELTETINAMNTTMYANKTDHNEALSATWLIVCGALVMLMQAGFALLEAGLCREKNVQSVLMKNVIDCCVGTIMWFVIGWGLGYGNVPEDGFAGSEEFAGAGFIQKVDGGFLATESVAGYTTKSLDWFFQWAFCNTASTIVSGGVAERLQIGGYVVFTMMMTGIIYPIIVAWTWSGSGWLATMGYLDFAGSGIVHLTGGVGALVGALITGPRKGRFDGADPHEFDAHNMVFVVTGTFILWFGWYGFNCGSTLWMDGASGKMAAHVAVNTTISASVGGFVAAMLSFAKTQKWDLATTCGGILAGLVSITANCGNVENGMAVLIGLVGACIFYATSTALKAAKIDDPIDAFAVHGACGIWGVLAVALCDWGMDPEFSVGDQFGTNFVGVLAIMAWSGAICGIVFFSLKITDKLRISEEMEAMGMDEAEFASPKAYRTTQNTWGGDQKESKGDQKPVPLVESMEKPATDGDQKPVSM